MRNFCLNPLTEVLQERKLIFGGFDSGQYTKPQRYIYIYISYVALNIFLAVEVGMLSMPRCFQQMILGLATTSSVHVLFRLKGKCGIWEGNKKSTKQIKAKKLILLF